MGAPPIRAMISDRDGVLTYFDLAGAPAFFQPLLGIGIKELVGRWEGWGDRVGFPCSLVEEALFWHGFWGNVCGELGLDEAIRARAEVFDYTSVVRPFSDARPALLEARSQGLKIGVLSNFSLASLDASLTAAGLADLVDSACAATVIGVAKPQRAAYEAVVRALGVAADECCFFDDEMQCVEGARALGMRAYRVDRQRPEHELHNGIVRDLVGLGRLLRDDKD